MSSQERLPTGQVLRVVAAADPREFSLFLGAGASKSSGVPLASEMVAEWREMMFDDRAPPGVSLDDWCHEQAWYGQPDEYSVLFETLFPNERARQKYVEPKIEAGFPNWGYLYLANLVNAGYFNVIFTTNFDDLINDALSMYLAYNPVVCAADSEVLSINIATDRAKIIKLHGDYLFKKLKNTAAELAELDPNMKAKFSEFSKQCGMVVIGYAGRDQSVMSAIESTFDDDNAFPIGVWWGLRPGEEPSELVEQLAGKHPHRFKLFECQDFDSFMVELHSRRDLTLPDTVVKPYRSVETRFSRLIGEVEQGRFGDDTIREHVRQLKKELGRPWAKVDAANSDLLEARLATGKREYQQALVLIESYLDKEDSDADLLTTWGDALALKFEEEHDAEAGEAAVARWQEAVKYDPEHLQARYSMARFFHKLQRFREAIGPAEELVALVPNDTGIARNLVQLYAATGRTGEAAELLDKMLANEPNAADLHAMEAAVCEQRGLVAAGLEAITRAVELDGDNAYYRFALANGLARMRRTEEAERQYLSAIRFDPKNLGFRLQAAQFFYMCQLPDRAIDQLLEVVEMEPRSAEARGLLGELLLSQNRVQEALEHNEAALRLSPDDSRLLINSGLSKLRSRYYGEAEHDFTRAAGVNAQAPQPHYWLAVLYWVQSRDMEVQRPLVRLSQLAPQVARQLNTQLQTLNQQTMGVPAMRHDAFERFMVMGGQGQPMPEEGPSVTDSIKSVFSRWLRG